MRSTERNIFISRKFSFAIELAFLKINISIIRSVGVFERAVLIFRIRFEILGIHFLNFIKQFFVGRFIVAFGKHHCQRSTGLQ